MVSAVISIPAIVGVPTVVNIPFRGSVVVTIPWCSGPLLCCSPAAVDVSGICFGDPAVIGVPLHPSFLLYRCLPFCCCSSFCCWRQIPCCGWSHCSYCCSNCCWHPFCYRCFQRFWRPCCCWPSCCGLAYLLWPVIPLLLASLHPLTTPLLTVFYCFWHPCFCWCPLMFQISLVLLFAMLLLFTLLLFFRPCGPCWLGTLLLLLSHCCWCLFYWFLLFSNVWRCCCWFCWPPCHVDGVPAVDGIFTVAKVAASYFFSAG